MNMKFLHVTRIQLVALLIGSVALLVWATQALSTMYQKGVTSGKSIRISEVTSCSVNEVKSEKPNFSGCNSIT